MKLIQLIPVLALASAVGIGCNSGPPITGITEDVGTGGGGGSNGTGGGGGVAPGFCTTTENDAVYADLEYVNDRNVMSSGTDAASAIGSDCVRGSQNSQPPVDGCGSEVLAVVGCFPNCPPEPINALADCVSQCIQTTIGTITGGGMLSEDCLACYGETVACGAANCTNFCSVDTTAPDCIDCRCTMGGENGCTPDFVVCSGIPSADC